MTDLVTLVRGWLGPGYGVAGGAVVDWDGPLYRIEAAAVARAVPARRAEFAAGRMALRAALLDLDYPPVALPRTVSGAPDWPLGLSGSLSHGGGAVLAVLTDRPGVGVGVDLEPWAPLDPETAAAIGAPTGMDGLRVFCAREAVFKAQHPVTGAWLDHADVAVRLDADGFTANLTRAVDGIGGDPVWTGRQGVAPGPEGPVLVSLLVWRHDAAAGAAADQPSAQAA